MMIRDIDGNELNRGDLVVFEHYGGLNIGRFSHVATSTVIIKDNSMKFNIRQIQIDQTNSKILKIKR